jgi:hypothetical protein
MHERSDAIIRRRQHSLLLIAYSRGDIGMHKHVMRVALLAGLASAALAAPAQAITGDVQVVVVKAGLIAGAGAGRGILTFRGRDYRFRIVGLSLGFTVGTSINKLIGHVSYLHDVGDFPGTYTAVGAGGALLGGAGGVQLKNDKGVMISLRGIRAGLELSANLTGVQIAFR